MENSSIQHYTDGVAFDALGTDVRDALSERLSVREKSSTVDFVGLLWVKGKLNIFWPKGMTDRKDWQKNARLLTRVLRQAARSSPLDGITAGNSGQIESPVEIEILEDYRANGLFDTRERTYTKGYQGKIDWRKTIGLKLPLPDKNGSPIYTEPIVSSNVISHGLIRKIHAFAVGSADSYFHWLVAPDGKPEAPDLHGLRIPVSNSVALGLVRTELGRQFSDLRKKQLRLIETFLEKEQKDGERSSRNCIGITAFQTVWEEMCRCYYGYQRDKYPAPAIPAYVYETARRKQASGAPRPDAVIGNRHALAIIDAKYYDFSRTKPGWGDLVKQFFYAKAYTHDGRYKNVENVMVFPYIQGDKAKHAVVLNESDQVLDTEFVPIKLVFLDVTEVMTHFINRETNYAARKDILSPSFP